MSHANRILLAIIICSISFFPSCKKEIPIKNSDSDVSQGVQVWLKHQKYSTSSGKSKKINGATNKNANINLLIQNLDLDETSTESLDKQQDLLIIPIKDAVKAAKNLTKNSTLILFLITDKNREIKTGGIIYYIPKMEYNTRNKMLPRSKTFSSAKDQLKITASTAFSV